jgi:mono/diheme cytochrome c family protein
MKRALAIGVALAASSVAGAQERGATLYEQHCAVCHQPKGEGIPGFAPRLAGTLAERAKKDGARHYLAQLVVSGMMGPIVSGGEKFNDAMPPFASLADGDLIAVVGYVLSGLNQVPAEGNITAEDVAAARKRALPPNEVRRLREK